MTSASKMRVLKVNILSKIRNIIDIRRNNKIFIYELSKI